jgi:serine protease AprX
MLRIRTFAILTLVAAMLWVPWRAPDPLSKLDDALRNWIQHPTASTRVLIRTTAGATARVHAHLQQLPVRSVADSTSRDLIVADVNGDALRSILADAYVTRVSADAVIRKLGTSYLAQDVLLNTQALLPRTYIGATIGVAVIDSGILPNANIKVAATYDFTTGGSAKVGDRDPFGHGTHVTGLIASAGVTSQDLYEGIAPGVRLYALRALDQNGAGYTSNVINAINFAVANKSTLKIDVINLSLGHPIYESASTDPLVDAVEKAAAAGIVVVASAGNFGGDPTTHVTGYGGITSPGNAPNAITVGALETYQTVTREDDVVAWYSSRGPTWYDAFQKPDIVAPGTHLVSDVPTSSNIAKTYPAGLMKTSGTTNLMKLSGTSMSAGVVSGVVALMLEANRTKHPGARLTPNTVKAILEYTALPLASADTLTQGAGSLNAAGAIALAEAIDPNQPSGAWWLTSGVNTWTTIGGQTLSWGQRFMWGDRIVSGDQIYSNDPAWALVVVWGNRAVWGNVVVWGNSTVWDGNTAIWGNVVVWGNSLIGQTTGGSTTWGNLSGDVNPSTVVWGNLHTLHIAPASQTWGNLERANGDLVAK